MAKDEKKPRKVSKRSSTDASSSSTRKITKKMRPNPDDDIAMSKKLSEKLQKSRRTRKAKSPRLSSHGNSKTRVCANGKPMPPLAELEKMFENDSDDEQAMTLKINVPVNQSSTPTTAELTSPRTVKRIADKMMNFISNLPQPTLKIEEESETLLRDEDRPHFSNGSPTNLVNGDDCSKRKVVVCDEDEQYQNESINAKPTKSENIAVWLENCEKAGHSEGSNDSDTTIEYNYTEAPIVCGIVRSFSPLPSTSKDKETINRNDQLFNESLLNFEDTSFSNSNSINKINNESNMEKSEKNKYEETLKDDTDNELKPSKSNKNHEILKENPGNITCDSNADVEIIQPPCETIVINDEIEISSPVKRQISDMNETVECIEILEPDIKKESAKIITSNEAILINDDDEYKFINDSQTCDDITDVIDIDDIIAENKAIIAKYSNENKIDINTVTCVDSSALTNLNQETNKANNDECLIISPAKRLQDTSEKMQDIITNCFSNEPQNQQQDEVDEASVSSTLSSSWNKFNQWLIRLNHRNHAITPTTQNVDTTNDSVIVVDDIPSPAADAHVAPTRFQSTNRSSRNRPPIQRNIDVYISGDQTNLDVHIHGNNNRLHNVIKNNLTNVQDSPPKTSSVAIPQHVPASPPVKNYGDCPICMDSLAKNSVASTICGHVFCMRCIEAAFKVSGKKCPTCRKVLKKGGYHQLFL